MEKVITYTRESYCTVALLLLQGIPTLIIAVAGIDDAASVAIYGIIQSVMFSNDALWYQIMQGPIAIVGGLGFGVIWGALSRYVPEKGDVSNYCTI